MFSVLILECDKLHKMQHEGEFARQLGLMKFTNDLLQQNVYW